MDATDSYVPRLWTLKEICARFQQVWQEGGSPSLERFLSDVPEQKRSSFFRGLLKTELELRRKKQEPVEQAEYLQRFPQYRREVTEAFAGEAPSAAPAPVPPPAASSPSAPAPQMVPAPLAAPPAAPSGDRIEIQVIAGPHQGTRFTFEQHDTFLVGRSTKAHLRLQSDPHFSRFHFRLELNPPQCYLIDLGSRNGTFVNGQPVRECLLQSGDIISGGTTEMKIVLDTADQTLCLPSPAAALVAAAAAAPQDVSSELMSTYPLAASFEKAFPSESPETDDEPASQDSPPPLSQSVAGAHAPPAAIAIPGYDIQEELACGDLGVLYRAVQQGTQKTCALKVMRPAAAAADRALQMFLRECSVLGQLNHPHIVKFLDQGAANGVLYIATEYLPAIRISDYLRKRSLADRLRLCGGLMQQVLSALQYAHSRSFVHRDIKPGNIVISRQGNKLSAKLADFGVAKQYTNAGFSKLTRSGDVIGSLPYMAPEQFLNSRDARPAADLYSAAATLYTWLTGRTPHDFPEGRSQFLVVLEDAPMPIERRLPDLPPAVAQFMTRALAKEPQDRFTSADEMRISLQAAIKP